MSEIIVVTSGKGGVGKTTTSANIGTGLAMEGQKVVIMDADIGLRNLDVIMGLENRIIYDLVNVIEGSCRLRQALIRDKRYENLYLLPAAQTRDKNAVTPEQMSKLCEALNDEGFDYIIIDCPAGIEQGFKNAIAGANRAIVVATPEISAVRDADRIIGMLEANELYNPSLILNRVKRDMVERNEMMSPQDVSEILAIETIGLIPDDEGIVISSNRGEPIVADMTSPAGKEYRNIVRRIMGEDIPVEPQREKIDLFSQLKRLFKKG